MLSALSKLSQPFVSLARMATGEGAGEVPDFAADELRGEKELGLEPAGDHLHRLFVGWVPKLFTEQDLKPLFQQCGDVKDIIILKDKVTNAPRGCAFVSYATKEEAEAAISRLDRQVHLPGALSPLEVRFARSHQYVQAGQGPRDNRQLFFARAPVLATEDDMRALFAQYGEVEEVNLFRERRTHLSKGCGFVTMVSRDAAQAAMTALDEHHLMEGSVTPLAVKWADPDLQVKKRRAVEDSNAENRMLFFAKVLRSAGEDEVRALFARFGRVHDVNLFRAFQGAPTAKGCGLVTMGSNDEAAAAIEALDGRFTWDGMDSPMVVKWMDAALQKRRREEHLAAMRQGLVPSMAGTDRTGLLAGLPRGAAAGVGAAGVSALLGGRAAGGGAPLALQVPHAYLGGLSHPGMMDPAAVAAAAAAAVPLEVPPAGCAPDAYKLFVGNIPKHCTEEELRPFFESVGTVIELVVVRDKFTHESKGSAFVWYQTRAMADRAVMQLNVRHVLPDPTGEQDRPLVVRRANSRKPVNAAAAAAAVASVNGGGYGAAALGGMHPGAMAAPGGPLELAAGGAMLSGAPPVHVRPLLPMHIQAMQATGMVGGYAGYAGGAGTSDMMAVKGPLGQVSIIGGVDAAMAAGLPMVHGGAAGAGAAVSAGVAPSGEQHPLSSNSANNTVFSAPTAGDATYTSNSAVLSGVAAASTPGLMGGAAASSLAGGSNGGGDPYGGVAGGIQGAGVGSLSGMDGRAALTVTLTGSQMAMITDHIYSIQTMSGADVSSQAVAPGLFCLALSGSAMQVETAKNLVGAVLGQANLLS